MSGDFRTLAERAVACPAWRWMPGMRAVGGWASLGCMVCNGVVWADAEGGEVPIMDDHGDARIVVGALPDLDDPATLGCLLALVREAWGEPRIGASPITRHDLTEGWIVSGEAEDGPRAFGLTEDAALIAALEAAPARGVEVPRG